MKNIETKGNLIPSNYTKSWIEIPECPSVTSSRPRQSSRKKSRCQRSHGSRQSNLGTRLERDQADAS